MLRILTITFALFASLRMFAQTVPAPPLPPTDPSLYLTPHPHAGQTLSDITYRVISIYAPGMDDSVSQMPSTGTLTILPSPSEDIIRFSFDGRIDGVTEMKAIRGEYRAHVTLSCLSGTCATNTDASAPFYNPTIWGSPKGDLIAGQTWAVKLISPWELGPPGTQTITVVSVDRANGTIVLKRQGDGDGAYVGAPDTVGIKKDGKSYKVAVKRDKTHWVGQAVIQQGVIVSDELLSITSVELSSPELGVIHARERQYMSVLEHPEPIPL